MTSRRSEAPEAALLPLFQGRRGCNLSFVLDSSEKMRVALEAVKRLLIQTLLTKASLRDSLFNIMTFSGKVRRDEQLTTTPQRRGALIHHRGFHMSRSSESLPMFTTRSILFSDSYYLQ